MSVPTFPGVEVQTITSARLTTRVLFHGPPDGVPVLLLHGNNSSATWWEEVLATLPPNVRGLAPDQRGFGDADPAAKIDARRGMGDLADDAVALLDALHVEQLAGRQRGLAAAAGSAGAFTQRRASGPWLALRLRRHA